MHNARRPVDPLDQILDEDTREEMRRLMPLIQSRTGPGSGFEIRGDRVTGIRPICAFLASERLGNNDINVETARKAACLAPKHFNETLDTIRRALSSKPKEAKAVTSSPYLTLLEGCGILNNQDFVLGYMHAFEREAVAKLPARLKPPNGVVTITVFVFTCQIIGMSKKVDADDLRKRHKVTQKDFDKVQAVLQASCSHIEQAMRDEIRALRASKTRAGGSPTKQTPARSPTKPIVTPGLLGTLSRTPTRKRKLPAPAFEDDMAADETPTKRQRRQTRSTDPSAFHAVFTRSSGSKTALELLANMQSEDDGDASSVEPVTAESDQEMDALSELSAPSASSGSEELEPRTPRRTTRTFNMVTPSRTANERNVPSRSPGKMTKAPVDDDEDRPAQRRCRPVFLGHKQWQQEDSRVARERREREERMRQWLTARGMRHPFDVVVQDVAPV